MSTTPSFLFKNGLVYTVDPKNPKAEALVIKGRDIVFVGVEKDAAAHVDATTTVVDLKGGMVCPGFIDAHDHYGMGGSLILKSYLLRCTSKWRLLLRQPL